MACACGRWRRFRFRGEPPQLIRHCKSPGRSAPRDPVRLSGSVQGTTGRYVGQVLVRDDRERVVATYTNTYTTRQAALDAVDEQLRDECASRFLPPRR